MSSWANSSPAARRPSANPNGSAQQLRLHRRTAPYPGRGEERTDELKDVLDSYEELEQMQSVTFEAFKQKPNVPSLQPSTKTESCTPADRRKALYQKFYRQVQEERKPPDCVVLSVTNQCLDYPKSLSQCLQERGLSVEMLYLQVESGLTRALQDVRAGGSPLCILVEQTNVALSSCTVIIFSESLKIHRNMPKDQAMDFVTAEYSRGLLKDRTPRDPADIAAQTSQLLDDYLDREKVERHSIPSETRQLLMLLAEGVHLYPEELETISGYVRSRQEYIHASNTEGERGSLLLTSGQGFYPKSKPPSLLSLNQLPCPPLAGPSFQGSFNGPPLLRGPPLLPHSPLYHSGSRGSPGMRGAPPLLKSSRPPLLLSPGPPPLRPSGPRH
ncbi:nuclear receptor coactivator 5 isoform X2 [Solea solea]|uniref:nuclear receptor coactivator 5 isoform X2 n=1 Tax=Solea solea TaxID=90069 RepID=UPI00272CABC7|nr:nuclear receptor coactivator 5 isoform X2 [Solea solea]